jgi:ATP-binding cassette subfamily C protein
MILAIFFASSLLMPFLSDTSMRNSLALGYGSTIALVLLFIRAAPQITSVQGSWQDIHANLPAVTAMYTLRSEAIGHQETVLRTQQIGPKLAGDLEFKSVCYAYPGTSIQTLQDVGFIIPANCVTAIIGPSGSGKTTIADLIMGLLEPSGGSIKIDGTDLTEKNRRIWRESIAYVAQDSVLIHDTLAANLAFGRVNVSEDDMWLALKTVSAEHFVGDLPDGLNTIVGDRGLRLSGGERQRITLARALLRKPQLLILDEATSALDWENQAIIAGALKALRGTVTVVTIAHRPSLISFADWVVAIDNGRVVETGAYDLIANSEGSYLSRVIGSEG